MCRLLHARQIFFLQNGYLGVIHVGSDEILKLLPMRIPVQVVSRERLLSGRPPLGLFCVDLEPLVRIRHADLASRLALVDVDMVGATGLRVAVRYPRRAGDGRHLWSGRDGAGEGGGHARGDVHFYTRSCGDGDHRNSKGSPESPR